MPIAANLNAPPLSRIIQSVSLEMVLRGIEFADPANAAPEVGYTLSAVIRRPLKLIGIHVS